MTPATTRAFFSAMKVENRSTYVRAYRNNKKDTIGRKCHRRNAKEISFFSQRFSADRETLSRVLQSALIAGQGTHTVQEASHGHSSCAGSEDPVWTWSWCTGLARASEGEESGRGEGKLCPPVFTDEVWICGILLGPLFCYCNHLMCARFKK